MHEDPHALHKIIKLLVCQSLDDRRNLLQTTVTVFLGESDFDVELHFEADRRSIDEDFVRCHALP